MANALRAQMVAAAVSKAHVGNLDITIRNVSMFLPGPSAYDAALKEQPPFELDDDDLAPYLPQAVPPEPPTRIEEPQPVLPEPGEQPEPPQVRVAKLEQHRLDLERQRVELRFAHDTAVREELAARNNLDNIARAFLAGYAPPVSHDQLLRQHAATEAQRRQDIADGKLPGRRAPTVGPSALDRYAAAQRGGGVGFAHRGYTRGGQPVSRRTMPGVVPTIKLPSGR